MGKVKSFYALSKSQRNRRLRRLCNNDLRDLSSINYDIEMSPTETSRLQSDVETLEFSEVCENNISISVPDTVNISMENTSDCDSFGADEIKHSSKSKLSLKDRLAHWVCNFNITHQSTTHLLKILRTASSEQLVTLPSDSRALLGSPRKTEIRSVPPGNYFHYGLQTALEDQLNTLSMDDISTNIIINVNIDGLPISKSSKSQLYPILGQIVPNVMEPFVIGIYHGHEKPFSCNLFLQQFIEEYKNLHEHGFTYFNHIFKVTIRTVICDAPARSYVTYTKGHGGYFGCGKCREEGDYDNHRMLFLNSDAELRTDSNFLLRVDEEHHSGISIFEEAQLGMVSQFPLDYMHLACLGAMKKILQTFVNGPHLYKFSARMMKDMSARLLNISGWIPSEFVRKCRGLGHVDRWKATEFRLFLLYTGPVVLQDYLPREYMIHFIALHCAIRILCDKDDCVINNAYANSLLRYFVNNCDLLYGKNFLIYNIHNLIHVAGDVQRLGPLDSFSAFPFENFLYTIKNRLKKSDKALEQLHRRIVERATCHLKSSSQFCEEIRLHGRNKSMGIETGMISFYTIHYKTFKLSLRAERDRYCYLNGDTVVRIDNIYVGESGPTLSGQSLLNSHGFLHYPIDSKEFNIVVGNKWSTMLNFATKDVTLKAICIPYQESFCFLPLLYTTLLDTSLDNSN